MKPAVTAVCAALAILFVADTHAAPNPEAVGCRASGSSASTR